MSRYYRQVSRPRLVDTPRLPSAPTFHAPQILMAEVYSQVTPGTGGEVLPLCWNKHGDGGDPEYLAILPATDVYSMIDPFHICCGGKGDRFFVYFDPYRKVWMPLAPYGLIRNGELGDQLAPQGQSDGSTINLFDKDGNGAGVLADVTIYSGISTGDPIPSGTSVPVFYVSGEQKWYTTLAYFEP